MIEEREKVTIYDKDANLSASQKAMLRIKKIMNLQARATTEGEAQEAAAALQRELTKHNLTMSDIEYVQITIDEPVEDVLVLPSDYGFTRTQRRIGWIENLASTVALAHFCKIYVSSGSNKIYFVGRKSNRDVAVKAFGYLANVARELVEKEAADYKNGFVAKYDWDKVDTRGFKSSFLNGFVSKISARYSEQQKELEQEAENDIQREAEEKRRIAIEQLLEDQQEAINARVDELFEDVTDGDTSVIDELFEIAENEVREKIADTVPLEVDTSQALVRLTDERVRVKDWFGQRKWGRAAASRTSSHNSSGWSRGNSRGGQVSLSGNVLR